MQQTDELTDYHDRLSRVSTYIHDHLDDRLDLGRIAEVACLSPSHWHRIYHAVHGETIADTVRRLRLHRAAGQLAHAEMPIDDVAQRAGYGSVQAFTRAFSAAYGLPPARYREQGAHAGFEQAMRAPASEATYSVEIREVAPLSLVGVEHVGSYMEIGRAFGTLYNTMGARGLIRPGMRSLGLYHDDPTIVAEARLRSCACATIAEPLPLLDPPLVRREIAGGPYAVLRHKGPYATMRAAYEWMFGRWLVDSGREAADAPVVEEYLNDPRDTAPAELLTEIWMPLKG